MSTLRLTFFTLPLLAGTALATAACGVPLAATGAGYAADGGVLASTNKTSADHLISMVSKQDCAMWRVIRGRQVCKAREGDQDPYKVDYSDPQRSVSEDGVQYGPPLRSGPDVPAASWDAAAYRSEPVPKAPAAGPTTAIAEAPAMSPGPTPARAAAAVPAKPAKAKTRSVRKPSRHPAAPAS